MSDVAKIPDYQSNLETVAMRALNLSRCEMPLVHRFTPGLYIREIFMPKGALVVSLKHLTEHPFVVSKGHAAVLTETGVQQIKAPHCGITKAGTQRVLFIHEDCVWTTFHVTNETDPEKIVSQVTEKPPFEGNQNCPTVSREQMQQLCATATK